MNCKVKCLFGWRTAKRPRFKRKEASKEREYAYTHALTLLHLFSYKYGFEFGKLTTDMPRKRHALSK